MKKALKWISFLLGVLVVGLAGVVMYLKSAAAAKLDAVHDVRVDPIPIPFPLSPREIAALTKETPKPVAPAVSGVASNGDDDAGAERANVEDSANADPVQATPVAHEEEAAGSSVGAVGQEGKVKELEAGDPGLSAASESGAQAAEAAASTPQSDIGAIALQRAIARGKRYLESRAGCADCHGKDMGGKVVVDNPAMGQWIAPNITRGGVTKDYQSKDWVRVIRHGIKPNGKPALMPAQDFTWFSDQEISDIAAYIRSLPPVDREMPPSSLGPIFALILVNGDFPLAAERLDHESPRPKYPPPLTASVELGKHLGTTCQGCHGHDLSGGPVIGGDPTWPPARNLTFDESGLAEWSLEDFEKALREGVRPNGETINPVMPIALTKNLQDTEIEALYLYLKTIEKKPFGNH